MSYICGSCWNPVNWCESFDKFGHGDGDDCVHTNIVAAEIEKAGYSVEVFQSQLHNPIVVTIAKPPKADNALVYWDNVPEGNNPGYSNPRDNLPAELVATLDEVFGKGEFFG
jgi:hypothetical protein